MVVADKVIVELQAKLDQYNANVVKAQTSFDGAMRRIQASAVGMERRVSASAATAAASLAKAFAVAGGIRGMQTLLDSATRIDNALKVAGLSGENLERVYRKLRDSAVKNAAPLEAMVTLYGRIAQAQDALNVSEDEMTNFVDKIGVALRVSGASAQEAAGALLQLSQALGAGTVRAEEFNSINEGARPILQAVAAGLKEAGGDVAKLRSLVMDGKVSSEAFFRAFEAGAVLLEQKVADVTLTTQQGMTNIGTAMVNAMRDFAKGSTGAKALGDAFDAMANQINSINFEKFGEQARELIGLISQIREAMGWLQSMGGKLGSALGTDAFGDWATGGKAHQSFLGGAITITNQRGIQRQIDEAFGSAVDTASALTEEAIIASRNRMLGPVTGTGRTGRLPSTAVNPVSLNDLAPPSGSGSGRRRGGGGSRSNEYERLSQRIREGTDALNAETAALSRLNPLVNDYGFALEKARAEQELLAAAQQAGIKITPELRAGIDTLANAYANAEVGAAKLRERQDSIVEAAGFVKDSLGGMISDMIPAIETGNAALDRFLNTLIEAVAQAALLGSGPLAGLFGMGGGGLLGGLFGGFRASGGPVSAGKAYMIGERGPEMFLPTTSGQIIPNHSVGGSQSIVINAPINAPGADAAALARVEASVKELGRNIPKMVDQRVNTRQTRGTRP